MIIEKYLIEELNKILDVPVFGEEPENKPDEYVTTQRVGRLEKNHIITDSIAFKSHSISKDKASDLDDIVQDAVKILISSNEISSIKLKSSYENSDTTIKKYRYQSIFDITYKR